MKPLRVLIVEDSPDDEALVLRELRRGGFEVTHRRVQTGEAMREALADSSWELVLSDFSMPEFDGYRALDVLAESGLDIPLIIVSGTIGEETAVGALQAGARDFVLKHRLARLVPAVERALREAEGRRAHRRAEEASQTKSRFLASMSHELRTPLNAIIGFADILLSGDVAPDAPEQKEFLGDILKSGHHLLRLINDVLDLSKVEAGKLEFDPEPIGFSSVAGEVVSVVRATAAAKGVLIDVDAGDVGSVVLDPGRLKQVLYNYLSNAIKFTSRGGTVTLRARVISPDSFRVEVVDTGVGISARDMARLFSEFQQVGEAKANEGGTGLGLALTKRLVEAQGGSVGVTSVVGEGSTFFAILPRDGSRANGPAPSRAPPPAADELAPLVLAVDDDPASLRLLHATLTPLGYGVTCCTDARTALEKARAQRPAAIVLDLLMPLVDGFEFLARYRASPENLGVPVIVWTAKDLGREEEAQLARAGATIKLKGRDGPAEVAAAVRKAAPIAKATTFQRG